MTVQADLFGDSTLAGADKAETSVYAARLTLPRTGSRRHDVLKAVARQGTRGLTDEEMHAELGMKPTTHRPLRVELVNQGWVEDSGQRRPTDTGAPSIVWRLSQRGYDRGVW